MSNQLVITSGAKVRNLEGVLTGTSGVVNSVPLGAANGVATLDSGGKVPVSQLPSSVVTYLGTWNAATNTPTLTNGVGDAGDMYICNVAGTVNFGAGPITFAVGDWVLYGSGTWQKSSGQNGTVTSVGASITGNAIGLTGSPITTAGTLAFAFAGTAAQYINGAGNLVTFPTTIAQAQRLITEVYNETGSTLTKGTVVYINGGHGNLPTVTKAIATGDATSAQTYGVVQNDITDNNNGYVVVIGSLGDLDTQAYPNGTQLYLSSTTAGAWTSTKQYAPAHLVYVGIVVRSHPTQGVVEVRIQNGFELDELHNVSAQTPTNNQGLFYNSSTSLWENKSIATALGFTPANDALVVHLAGTETITGIKTFSNGLNTDYIGITGDMTMDGSFLLKHVAYGTLQSGYTNLSGQTNGLRVGLFGGYNALLNFSTSGSYTYTFPNATGTIALTSDIPSLAGYVTLATTQTITGAKTFNSGTKFDLGLFLKESSSSGRLSGYVGISATATGGMQQLQFLYPVSGSSVFSLPTTGSFNYEFPAASGTVALLEFSQTFSGLQSFTNTAGTDLTYGAYLTKNSIPSFSSSLTVNLYSASGNNNLVIRDNGNTSKLQFQAISSYTYTFPALTGTLALTSDIPSLAGYVPYTGATGAVNLGNYELTSSNLIAGGTSGNAGMLHLKSDVVLTSKGNGYTSIGAYAGSGIIQFQMYIGAATYKSFTFSIGGLTDNTNRQFTLPNASGTLALTSDLTGGTVTSVAALTIGTSGTDLSSSVANSTTTPVITLNVPTASATNRGVLSSADWTTFNNKQNALTNPVTGTGTTNYLPKFTGTSTIGNSAITDDGTTVTLISRALSGTSATFSATYSGGGTVNIMQWQRSGGAVSADMTYNDANTSMNFGTSTSHTLNIKTNNTTALSLASTGAATFSSSVTSNGYFALTTTSDAYATQGTLSWNSARGTVISGKTASVYDFAVYGAAAQSLIANPTGTSNISFPSGNVLIGTTTDAGYKLDVNGTARVSGVATAGALYLTNTANSDVLEIFQSPSVLNSYFDYPASRSLNFRNKSTGTALILSSTGAATFSSSVTASGGNFGGGTPTGSVLFVNGTIDAWQSSNTLLRLNHTGSYGKIETFTGGGYGNTAINPSGGNVLIGTSTDRGFKLVVEGTDNNNLMGSYNTTSGASLRMQSNQTVNYIVSATNQLQFEVGSAIRMAMPTSGNILIGTTTDDGGRLTVKAAGNTSSNYAIVVRSSTADLFYARGDGYINTGLQSLSPYYNSISGRAMIVDSGGGLGYTSSTRESKINIENLNDVSWLLKLNPVSYNYRKKDNNNNYTNEAQNERWYGLIADETEPINSDLVFYNEIDNNKKLAGVEYNKLIAPMLKLLQEQQAQIQELKQLINK